MAKSKVSLPKKSTATRKSAVKEINPFGPTGVPFPAQPKARKNPVGKQLRANLRGVPGGRVLTQRDMEKERFAGLKELVENS